MEFDHEQELMAERKRKADAKAFKRWGAKLKRASLEGAAIFSLPGVRRIGGIVLSADAVAEHTLGARGEQPREARCYKPLTIIRKKPDGSAEGLDDPNHNAPRAPQSGDEEDVSDNEGVAVD